MILPGWHLAKCRALEVLRCRAEPGARSSLLHDVSAGSATADRSQGRGSKMASKARRRPSWKLQAKDRSRPVMSGAVPVKIVWESEEVEAEMAQRLLQRSDA